MKTVYHQGVGVSTGPKTENNDQNGPYSALFLRCGLINPNPVRLLNYWPIADCYHPQCVHKPPLYQTLSSHFGPPQGSI